jgi:hypothetical protein
MIKITSTANKTITVSNSTTSGTSGFICLGVDCQVKVFDGIWNEYEPNYEILRTVNITNKYTGVMIASVNIYTLDATSTSYSSDMDTYASNLISVLYA